MAEAREVFVNPEVGLDADAAAGIGRRIQADIDAGNAFGGSVVVARGGVIGYRAVLGEVAPGRPAAADDRYVLLSLSKSYTASLVLRAVDQGRFDLDTRVRELIPGFEAGGKQHATVRQLLTHSAGVFSRRSSPPPLTAAEMGDLHKSVTAIAALPAEYVPGERVVYDSLASYALLGRILELTDPAGRLFRDVAREDLFEPLGMKETTFGLGSEVPHRVPVSFTRKNSTAGSQAVERDFNAWGEDSEIPGGNAYSTIDDVFRFAETLRRQGGTEDYRLLSPALFAYASRNHTGDRGNGAWDAERTAEGIPDFPVNFTLLGGYTRGHGHHLTPLGHTASPRSFGAVGGGSTFWMVDPDRDLTVVFLSAGIVAGLSHVRRTQNLADLALAALL